MNIEGQLQFVCVAGRCGCGLEVVACRLLVVNRVSGFAQPEAMTVRLFEILCVREVSEYCEQ